MALNSYLSVFTLNVNGLNAPVKRHRVTEWIGKEKKTKATKTRKDQRTPPETPTLQAS